MSLFPHLRRFASDVSGAGVTAALLLAFAFTACGGAPSNNDNTDGGPLDEDEPNPAYFGLEDGLCFRYDFGGGNLWFTLEIREDDGVAVRNTKTWAMIYRYPAGELRTDWVEATSDGDLLLHRRRVPGSFGTQPTYDVYDPAPVLLREGMADNAFIQTDTDIQRTIGSARTETTASFRTVVTGRETVTALGETYDTQSVQLSIVETGAGGTDRVRFAPDVGFVRIDPDGNDLTDMLLGSRTTLGEGEVCDPQ